MAAYSALVLAARTTLAHFSVYSTMNLPNSAGEFENGVEPKSVIRPLILVSESPALILFPRGSTRRRALQHAARA
jgi:hypothetical protein